MSAGWRAGPGSGVLALLSAALIPGAAWAQPLSGSLRGTVVSVEREVPVPGALVLLESGPSATADAAGRFALDDVPPGHYRIAGVAPGCHVGVGEVDVLADQVVVVRLSLPLPAQTEERLEGWHTSRIGGDAVRSISALEIRQRNLRSVEEALRVIAPEMVGVEPSQAGVRGAITGRRSATISRDLAPLVVVDGVRIVDQPADVLAGLSIDEVEHISVGKGASAGWRYGLQGVNGVITIVTRGGAERALATGPRPEQCGFTFGTGGDPGAPAP